MSSGKEPTLTDREREMIDKLAESISSLLHMVVARKLEQFFVVIKQEVQKEQS